MMRQQLGLDGSGIGKAPAERLSNLSVILLPRGLE
jgi:hypothetical protein